MGKPEIIGVVDYHGVHVGYIDPVLDDRGRDENGIFFVHELVHNLFQLGRLHLPVRDDHADLGNDLFKHRLDRINGLDPVVDEEHLPSPVDLLHNSFVDYIVPKGMYACDDGQPVDGRRVDKAQIAHANERHVERPRYRRRC